MSCRNVVNYFSIVMMWKLFEVSGMDGYSSDIKTFPASDTTSVGSSFCKGIIMKRIAAEGIFHLVSPHSMKTSRDRLERALTGAGFIIFAHFDHSRAAAIAGLQLTPTLVVVFGNPRGGTELMRLAPSLAIDLPSRILLHEKHSRKTDIFSRLAYAAERHGLKDKAREVAAFDALVIALLRKSLWRPSNATRCKPMPDKRRIGQ